MKQIPVQLEKEQCSDWFEAKHPCVLNLVLERFPVQRPCFSTVQGPVVHKKNGQH